tara:strand:+ start:1469 stop:2458 length:990 start_codon:yes stop_codon:yes gene_type:complete
MHLFDNEQDIKYEDTQTVVLNKKGKPEESWMKDWSQEDRFEKFFEFCHKFDEREDTLLKSDYQIFSHRLHWHQHPFCDIMQDVDDNLHRMWYTLVFSFSNEHWLTLTTLIKNGVEGLQKRFISNRHARNDLFQIYYPKGTNVKEWLVEGPKKAAEDMHHILEGRNRPYTMMELAKKMATYFAENQGFRNPMYPCKNFARYIAMAYPHICDPESVLFGGTGHFDGMHQIFGGKNLMSKVKYDINEFGLFTPLNKYGIIWMEQMQMLAEHKSNPIKEQKWLNIEDKTCFFYKHIAINHSVKSPTKRIPYEWIFPRDFSLKVTNENNSKSYH